jgi:uncharacterized protein YecE (DUF72 family)
MSHVPGEVFIGPAGWSYADWKGVVYPPGMPRGQHALTYLARYFNTVEINVSFYRPPVARHGESWLKKVQDRPDFLFTAKLWQRYTHERHAWPAPVEERAFKEGLRPLHEAGKLGALLVQFPWSFRRTVETRPWLARIADTFAEYPLVVEVRHDSWDVPEVHAAFRERGIAFCNIDQPLFGHSVGPSEHVTAPVGYVRLHGRNHAAWFAEGVHQNERYNYLYNPAELQPWIERVQRMRERVKRLFVVTNNHYRGQAVVNAIEMQRALQDAPVCFPASLAAHYPQLHGLGTPG